MTILCISGSERPDSTNQALLRALPSYFRSWNWSFYPIHQLPLFAAAADHHPWNEQVIAWRTQVRQAQGVIIITPEYLHNLPAAIKNALEWLTSSGELMAKPVLPITYTPNAPRGENTMKALTWSLQALDARIVTSLTLYQQHLKVMEEKITATDESLEFLLSAVTLLSGNSTPS